MRDCLPAPSSPRRRDDLIAFNEQEYGLRLLGLDVPDAAALREAENRRAELLADLDFFAACGCHGTKLDINHLSPGCRICVDGGWSCLFINGRCNGGCFYCPAPQNEIGSPGANGLEFTEPQRYVRYLERFGFSGASISGGEPLLTPERTLAFVAAIKKRFGQALHLWLYSNGILADYDTLAALADAGLDEMRFDIGATAYRLDAARRAAALMPTVTVEIPAIPEEEERLKSLLPQLRDAGVKHLNLHQLRLTPHNYERLQPRGYRWLHGEKVTSLDSELTALSVLRHSLVERIGVPVNYCSFPYKYRFQGRAARRRCAAFLREPTETLTDNGFLRSLSLLDAAARLDALVARWRHSAKPEHLFKRDSGERLRLHPDLLTDCTDGDAGGLTSASLRVEYRVAYQRQRVSGRLAFREVALADDDSVFIEEERATVAFTLDAARTRQFAEMFLQAKTPPPAPDDDRLWADMLDFERPRRGLQEYF
ncbi:MAG: radical SAM protein [Desulfobulbaceae bacterium]|jgi:pyruvate formate-lyase activating enzyme-like uncharacterized protein|nr:radical SAM protein [Desulfobulbaceae bacterium]